MNNRVIVPEVVENDATLPRDLQALRRFAVLLDSAVAIPGTRRRIGLSSTIGLIPGVGDAIGAVISGWIVLSAIRHRVPAGKITRMVFNILLDMGVGTIPVIGDIFDILFTENLGNVELLIANRNRQKPPRGLPHLLLAAAIITVTLLALAVLFVVLLAAAMVSLLGRPLI